jgi:hypothetical protein
MLPVFLQPLIAGGLNLIANAALAKGKEWVQEKTGIDISKASLNDADLAKLQQFEMDHEEELLRIKVEDNRISADLEKAYLKDVQDARDMNKATVKSEDPFVRRFIYYLAVFWSVASATYIGFITFGYIPPENTRFADTILGFLLGTAIASILNFFYGSSKGSHDKTEALAKELAK